MTAVGPRATFDRRQLLRTGGLTLSLGAIIAACGEDRAGGVDPGRVGNAPDVEPLAAAEVDDIVLLRTAQSLEHSALDTYAAARGLDVLSAGQDTIAQRFVDDHTGHSVALGGFITEAGGEEFACANPWLSETRAQTDPRRTRGERRSAPRCAQRRPRARVPRRRRRTRRWSVCSPSRTCG